MQNLQLTTLSSYSISDRARLLNVHMFTCTGGLTTEAKFGEINNQHCSYCFKSFYVFQWSGYEEEW